MTNAKRLVIVLSEDDVAGYIYGVIPGRDRVSPQLAYPNITSTFYVCEGNVLTFLLVHYFQFYDFLAKKYNWPNNVAMSWSLTTSLLVLDSQSRTWVVVS